MRAILLLITALSLIACVEYRYHRPDKTPFTMKDDIRACMYEGHRAGKWKDEAFVDDCMRAKSYTHSPTGGSPVPWMESLHQEFIDYDKQIGLTPASIKSGTNTK